MPTQPTRPRVRSGISPFLSQSFDDLRASQSNNTDWIELQVASGNHETRIRVDPTPPDSPIPNFKVGDGVRIKFDTDLQYKYGLTRPGSYGKIVQIIQQYNRKMADILFEGLMTRSGEITIPLSGGPFRVYLEHLELYTPSNAERLVAKLKTEVKDIPTKIKYLQYRQTFYLEHAETLKYW